MASLSRGDQRTLPSALALGRGLVRPPWTLRLTGRRLRGLVLKPVHGGAFGGFLDGASVKVLARATTRCG